MTLVQRRESDAYLAEKEDQVGGGGTVISGEVGIETKEEGGGGAATPKRAKGKSKASGGKSGRRRLTLRGLGGSNKKEKKKAEESYASAFASSARSAKEQLAPPPPPPPEDDKDVGGDDPAMRPSPTTEREAYLRQSREHHHHHRPPRHAGTEGIDSERARMFQRPPPMSTRATSGGSGAGSAVPPPQGFPVRGPGEEGRASAAGVVRPAPPLAAPAPPPVSSAMADAMDLEAEMAQYRRQSRAAPPAAPPPASPRQNRAAAQGGPLPSPYPAEDPRRRPAHTPGLPTSNARDDRPDMMRRPPALAPPDAPGNVATTTDLTGATDREAEMARYLRQSRAHPAHAAVAALPTTTTPVAASSPRSRFSAEETPRRSNSGKIVAAGEEEEQRGGVRHRGLAPAGNEAEGTPISVSAGEGRTADAATAAAAALVAAMNMGREPRARDALSGEELMPPPPLRPSAGGAVPSASAAPMTAAEANVEVAHSTTSSDRDGGGRSGNSITANLEIDELAETQQRHNRSDPKLPDSNHDSFTDLDDTRDHERTYRVSFAPQRNAVTSVKHIPIQHQPNVLFTLIDEANWTEVVLRAESAPHEVAQWVRPSASPSGEPIRLLALHAAAERWSRGGGMEGAAGRTKRGGGGDSDDGSGNDSGGRGGGGDTGSSGSDGGSQNRGSRGSHCVVRAFVSAFLAILRADPDAARYPDGDGRTLLHWAVDINDNEDDGSDSGDSNGGGSSGDGGEGMKRRPPPEEVFDALFGVYPEAARVREHRYGCLPLHVACSSCGIGGNGRKRSNPHRRSNTERRASVVRRLLKAFPEGALCRDSQRGWVPLHAAVRNGAPALVILELLRACPQAASVPDSDKRLPLHFAARYADNWDGGQGGGGGGGGELTRVLESLIDAYPESLKRREDKMGYTPLHTACSARHPQDVTDALLTAFLHRGPAGEVGVSPLVRAGSGGRPSAAAAKRTRALLSIPDYSQRLPLHVAAQSSQPFHVLRTLLLPNPTSAADQDRDGRIALHHAVSSRPCAPSSVSILLRAFPNGAKVVEGKRGWTPLHGAASSGGGCHKGVVAELLAHFPEGARTRDRSGALPLHLLCRPNYFAGGRASAASSSSSGAAAATAATAAKGSAHSLATTDSIWSLEVADMLLHAYPEGSRVKDRKGRTPLDLLLVDGQEGGSGGNSDDEMWRKAMRAVLMDDTATLREV